MLHLTKFIKVLSSVCSSNLKLFLTAVEGFKGVSCELVSDVGEADLAIINPSVAGSDELLNIIKGLRSDSIAIIEDLAVKIHDFPELISELSEEGFIKSWLPLDGCSLMISRRGFSWEFLRETIEIYRDSFINGPNPIHYNTAYAIYLLSKFTLARLNGLAVEVGTGRGFSTLWIAQAAKEVSSKVLSIDNRCDRVEYAVKSLRSLGLSNVEVVCGDAKDYLISDRASLVFIDARKDEYHLYLRNVERCLMRGSLVMAHNTLSSSKDVREYLRMVYSSSYESVTIPTDPAGLTISAYLG